MSRKLFVVMAIVLVLSMVLAACKPTPTATPTTAAPTEVPTTAPAKFSACEVTDTGGIDDKSFNATGWAGLEKAKADLGVDISYLESQQASDYEVNINSFIEKGCNLIIPVGFLLADATGKAADANPDQKFAIVDVDYLTQKNVLGNASKIDQATFLAGYLSAGMTKTGKVGTYVGILFPATQAFMDGYAAGIQKYNEVHGTKVELLGWDPATQKGLEVGNFESLDDGRAMGEQLLDEGADIIMPVAGPVGLGTLAVMAERKTGMLIGVDNDWSVANPDKADYILASALKKIDVFVYNAVKDAMDGKFEGGKVSYLDLANQGVGLAYGTAMGDKVPAALKAEIDALVPEIIAGTVSTTPNRVTKVVKACEVTDTGGIDDKSFNATGWLGLERAKADFGADISYLESQQASDYEVNINAFIEKGCDLIVPVGFLLADATGKAADANPDQKFAIVDVDYLTQKNVLGNASKIDQATFLAGYLAAGMTKTGKVGTYVGILFPATQAFMDGYAMGIAKYNEVHGTKVELLGWDPATQKGLEVGNFESLDDGRAMGEQLLDEGADIIMPVAGPVGLGTLAVMTERKAGLLIGVDNDWSVANPDKADYVLGSALKKIDVFVYDSVKAVLDGTFEGGKVSYLTLENKGVGLQLGTAWASKVPADLWAEVEGLIPGIIDGSIKTVPTR